MFRKLIYLATMFLYFASPFIVYADNTVDNIKEPSIKPSGGFYYLIKRGYEKILEKFQFSDNSKLTYHQNLLLNRLSELKYVAERKELHELQKATERFSYEAGKLAQISERLKNADKIKIQNQFNEYKPVLEKLRDLYEYNSSFFRLIQYDIDTLDILSKKL